MNDLLRQQDLVNNPSTRVPICLCLDVSGSMNRIVGGETRDTGRTVFRDGQQWNVVEGGVTALNELVAGVRSFYAALNADEVARYSAEICVVTFSGTSARLVQDFASLDLQADFPDLTADGETPMGEGVNLALDRLEARKQEYKDAGVDYYQPWLVLMTDGAPNGSVAEFRRAVQRTVSMESARKLTTIPIGIGADADMEKIGQFSQKKPPLRLKEMNFKGFFAWLSQSVSYNAQAMPGEEKKLYSWELDDGVKRWGEPFQWFPRS